MEYFGRIFILFTTSEQKDFRNLGENFFRKDMKANDRKSWMSLARWEYHFGKNAKREKEKRAMVCTRLHSCPFQKHLYQQQRCITLIGDCFPVLLICVSHSEGNGFVNMFFLLARRGRKGILSKVGELIKPSPDPVSS